MPLPAAHFTRPRRFTTALVDNCCVLPTFAPGCATRRFGRGTRLTRPVRTSHTNSLRYTVLYGFTTAYRTLPHTYQRHHYALLPVTATARGVARHCYRMQGCFCRRRRAPILPHAHPASFMDCGFHFFHHRTFIPPRFRHAVRAFWNTLPLPGLVGPIRSGGDYPTTPLTPITG